MNRQEFLAELRRGLTGIPQNDIEEQITFYSEMIDDRIEEGQTEETAVAQLGTIENIVMQIMSEIPLSKLVKEKVRQNRALRVWEIVLLVLGSPIWLSLAIALLAVIISVYVAVWSLIIAFWAIELSIAACSLAGIFSFAVLAVKGHIIPGIALFSAGLFCVGLAILGFFGCKWTTKTIFTLTKQMVIWIKSCFIKKEAAK